jgi:hypothetical protein
MGLGQPHSSIWLRFAMLPLKFRTDKRTIYHEVNNLSEAHISQTGQQSQEIESYTTYYTRISNMNKYGMEKSSS